MIHTSEKIKETPIKKTLKENEVHIWSARLNIPEVKLKKWQLSLSPDEIQRAYRFHFIKDQNHFIVARGVLRKILSYYIDRQPYEIKFEYNKYGKPFIGHELNDVPLRFNLSHSYGMSLYAIAAGREVGVDIEYIRENFSDIEIAERFFSHDEVTALKSLPAIFQNKAFFLCWTRKEAFIKAKGAGLSIPLDQFDVSLAPEQPAKLLRTKYDRHDVNRWTLFDIDLFSGYAAAVAVTGQNVQVNYQCSNEF
ncbi:MAG TPA: 4'-phosphopantetheinyl transferase superfamily protein [bacterium]